MGKVAQIKTSSVGFEFHPGVNRKEIARLLSCGHSPASIAAMYGMSMRDIRRMAKRVGA